MQIRELTVAMDDSMTDSTIARGNVFAVNGVPSQSSAPRIGTRCPRVTRVRTHMVRTGQNDVFPDGVHAVFTAYSNSQDSGISRRRLQARRVGRLNARGGSARTSYLMFNRNCRQSLSHPIRRLRYCCFHMQLHADALRFVPFHSWMKAGLSRHRHVWHEPFPP